MKGLPHVVTPMPRPQLLPQQDRDQGDSKTLLALTSHLCLQKLLYPAFTSENSTRALLKEMPLMLGSGRCCSLSSSVNGVDKELSVLCVGWGSVGQAS